jgi:hypothetical protein
LAAGLLDEAGHVQVPDHAELGLEVTRMTFPVSNDRLEDIHAGDISGAVHAADFVAQRSMVSVSARRGVQVASAWGPAIRGANRRPIDSTAMLARASIARPRRDRRGYG